MQKIEDSSGSLMGVAVVQVLGSFAVDFSGALAASQLRSRAARS